MDNKSSGGIMGLFGYGGATDSSINVPCKFVFALC